MMLAREQMTTKPPTLPTLLCFNLWRRCTLTCSTKIFFSPSSKCTNLEESLSPPEAGRTPCQHAQNPRADGHRFWLSTAAVVEYYSLSSHPGASQQLTPAIPMPSLSWEGGLGEEMQKILYRAKGKTMTHFVSVGSCLVGLELSF